MPAKQNSGRLSSSANQTTSFFFVSGLGSGVYSANESAGTRQRFSGFSQPGQWWGGEVGLMDGDLYERTPKAGKALADRGAGLNEA